MMPSGPTTQLSKYPSPVTLGPLKHSYPAAVNSPVFSTTPSLLPTAMERCIYPALYSPAEISFTMGCDMNYRRVPPSGNVRI